MTRTNNYGHVPTSCVTRNFWRGGCRKNVSFLLYMLNKKLTLTTFLSSLQEYTANMFEVSAVFRALGAVQNLRIRGSVTWEGVLPNT